MLNKFLIGAFILILLALDWAALHDILKANEPDLVGEYASLALSLVAFAFIAWFGFRNKTV